MKALLFVLLASLIPFAYAADPACQEVPKFKSVLLAPPASIEKARFEQCDTFDRVTFEAFRPYPDETLSDLILKRWQSHGWLPVLNDDTEWKNLVSKDRLRVGRYRKFTVQNSKGELATLSVTYTKTLDTPIPEGWPIASLEFNDVMHVQMTAPTLKTR